MSLLRPTSLLALASLLVACGKSTEAHIEDFCAFEYECFPEDWGSEGTCTSVFMETAEYSNGVGGHCSDAYHGLVACLDDIDDCDELDDYWTEPTSDYPCHEEEDEYYVACSEY